MLLVLTGPAALHGFTLSTAALRSVLLGSWVSAFGGLLMLYESPAPPVHAWLRRHFRFITTQSGRNVLSLCAATMALSIGPPGLLVAASTLANLWYSRWRAAQWRRAPAARPMPPLLGDEAADPRGAADELSRSTETHSSHREPPPRRDRAPPPRRDPPPRKEGGGADEGSVAEASDGERPDKIRAGEPFVAEATASPPGAGRPIQPPQPVRQARATRDTQPSSDEARDEL